MLKKRDLHESGQLFELLSHPAVFPYVRQKAQSAEEYKFVTKQAIEAEDRGELISRTILDDYGQPIGTINLFDIEDGAGFLGTWIGQPFQGLGYNQKAKQQFLDELFFVHGIQNVFLRIRKVNAKSLRAASKLPYVIDAASTHPQLLKELNKEEDIYALFQIPRDLYYLTQAQQPQETDEQAI
ncbi:GNAT family N-acetyltransferase [Planococcus lenghuensis]|uniref:N-acetyltransferase n=1 Tax=Planococcus lenghuensis TaxID=2213202 RepID=A0A1Q2KZ94_9BACL|nr:GNAT family protein [Planococcus lenghuensis]AQQ53511.1 N-acetyltransferase [Planococcus lenghuensis]